MKDMSNQPAIRHQCLPLQQYCTQKTEGVQSLDIVVQPDNLMQAQAQMSLASVLTDSHTPIKFIARDHGMQKTVDAMARVVETNLQFFKAKHKISGIEITVFASDFCTKYPFESFERVLLFFKLARTGEFGDHMHSLDSMKLFEWYGKFMDRVMDMQEANHNRQKLNDPLQIVTGKQQHPLK